MYQHEINFVNLYILLKKPTFFSPVSRLTATFHQKSDIELVFALKSRMINVKKNFSSQFKDDVACDFCKVHVDCQEHLLQCHELTKHVFIPLDVKYEDLFKNSDKQLRIVKIFKKLLRKREILITKN